MSARIGSGVAARVSTRQPGSRESRVSLYLLLWLIAAPFVGFVLAGDQVFDVGARGDWEVWKAAVIGGLLVSTVMTVFFIPVLDALAKRRSGRPVELAPLTSL